MDYTFLLQLSYFGNTIQNYLIALLASFVSFGIFKIFKDIIIRKLRKLAKATKNDFDDLLIEIISSIGYPLYLLISVGIGLQFVQAPLWLKDLGYWIAFVVIAYSVMKALGRVIDYFFEKIIKKRLKEDSTFDISAVKLLSKGLKGILWVVAILLIVQNLGYDITALIAGLGIGGIAIAFALQGILSDVFASFSIYFDKPFQTGDYITIGDQRGTVKHIGIKTTRLKSTQGEELVISNKDLTGSRIQNYGKMEKRRISFSFGVTYDTKTEKLKKIPDMIKKIIEKQKAAEFDRAYFTKFGDSALNFDVVFYFNSRDYAEYLAAQQSINLDLKEKFEQEKIEFAYPTQTIYVKK